MKKILSVLVIASFLVSLINMCLFIGDSFFYNLKDLPTGEFLYSSMSPSGDKTLKLYKVDSTLGKAVRGEILTIDGEGNTVQENVYWNVGADTAVSGWLDDDNVSIDGHVINTKTKKFFDCRNELDIHNEALEEKQRNNNYMFN